MFKGFSTTLTVSQASVTYFRNLPALSGMADFGWQQWQAREACGGKEPRGYGRNPDYTIKFCCVGRGQVGTLPACQSAKSPKCYNKRTNACSTSAKCLCACASPSILPACLTIAVCQAVDACLTCLPACLPDHLPVAIVHAI